MLSMLMACCHDLLRRPHRLKICSRWDACQNLTSGSLVRRSCFSISMTFRESLSCTTQLEPREMVLASTNGQRYMKLWSVLPEKAISIFLLGNTKYL